LWVSAAAALATVVGLAAVVGAVDGAVVALEDEQALTANTANATMVSAFARLGLTVISSLTLGFDPISLIPELENPRFGALMWFVTPSSISSLSRASGGLGVV
jgi:hypothetical protein